MTRFSKPKGIERTKTPFEEFTLEKATWRGGIITMPGILTMNRGPIRLAWVYRLMAASEMTASVQTIPLHQVSQLCDEGKDMDGHTESKHGCPRHDVRAWRVMSKPTGSRDHSVNLELGPETTSYR